MDFFEKRAGGKTELNNMPSYQSHLFTGSPRPFLSSPTPHLLIPGISPPEFFSRKCPAEISNGFEASKSRLPSSQFVSLSLSFSLSLPPLSGYVICFIGPFFVQTSPENRVSPHNLDSPQSFPSIQSILFWWRQFPSKVKSFRRSSPPLTSTVPLYWPELFYPMQHVSANWTLVTLRTDTDT